MRKIALDKVIVYPFIGTLKTSHYCMSPAKLTRYPNAYICHSHCVLISSPTIVFARLCVGA